MSSHAVVQFQALGRLAADVHGGQMGALSFLFYLISAAYAASFWGVFSQPSLCTALPLTASRDVIGFV